MLFKTFMHCGIKQIRNTIQNRFISAYSALSKNNKVQDSIENFIETDSEYETVAKRIFGSSIDHNIFIIHPYVKWGPSKVLDSNPAKQIKEAVALIRTLEPWTVQDTIAVPLENLDKKLLFGTGTLDKLRKKIRSNPRITAVFINMGTLKPMQMEALEKEFHVQIIDRYRIVMLILRMHAITKHAKLQVALAEIPYIRANLKKYDNHFIASSDFDTRKQMLKLREANIKKGIQKLREQRALQRQKRKDYELPVVAVVGYTNAGKTSLIKALTGERDMQPQDRLFATLDVTAHAGILPSKMKVLYVDTVGFLSNIPTNLIECFIATLEDAVSADLILHVVDMESEDREHQFNHVLDTLKQLESKTFGTNVILDKTITVGNKCDIAKDFDQSEGVVYVSAVTEQGIDILRKNVEDVLLKCGGRNIITITAPSGGDEITWLYKNATVTNVEVAEDEQQQNVTVIITNSKLQIFKHHFIKN